MKRRIFIFAGVALLSAALGVWWGDWKTSPGPAQASAAEILFTQSMPDPQGQAQALAQWQGKPLVVNFWATWCAPCVDEMPELSELHVELAPAGPHVLGIGIDSSENIRQFAAKYRIAYPLLVGGAGATEIARRFGNQSGGLPFTVLIDPAGKVRRTYLGRLKMEELRKDLAAL